LRIPTDCKELAEVVAREHGNIHRSADLNAEAVMRLLERCDALRQVDRFERILQACECDARGRQGFAERDYPQGQRLRQAQQAALSVETAPIAQAAAAQGLKGAHVGACIAAARVAAIAQCLSRGDA
jgi:tRNA nucleotidyltransferase (CCA-adding enzyme)